LTVLSKKGDLSLPKNYCSIVLLEVAYKIVAIILHARLLPIQGCPEKILLETIDSFE